DFCCGSAGTYNIFHYENSMKIFERKKQAVKKINPDLILTNCPTCILQFQDGLKSREIARHSVELIDRLSVVEE
nr:(Fe-S)-binding protein [candidate division Zixibacteria bacterium]NIR67429.1 (Fe-S)-binding protein [candidate division Zixibacteria bacterium]NIS16382.1 (Fe-S)-binding protein [candidate division Zixibacteria bacterium]NIS48768.1 (Fe-S)-binding protein [candidate division Zixibacteria bacterium]NIT52749.1 (Fe-S)-binding protein [candidate division Zixibacteria bacterium]